MIVKKINKNRDEFIELMLLADPDIDIVNSYIDQGDLFALYKNEKLVSCVLVLDINSHICELKNIATYEEHQNKGYAHFLVNYISEYYKDIYSTMIVGTANSSFYNIHFYEKCGFVYYKTIDNFFIDNYTEEIFEDKIQCIDMLYFKKAL